MLRRFTSADISDFGCAYNAYSRDALTPVLGVIGKQKFTKALVLAAGAQAVEVDLDHRAREDSSRYSPLRLTRLALHVLAGFWPQPIQWAGVLLGVLCGTLSLVVGVWATVVWVLNGDFPGQLYLGGLVLGVLAVQGFILALVGEYLGRIQRDVEGARSTRSKGNWFEQAGAGHRRRRVHLLEPRAPPPHVDLSRGRLARRAHLRGEHGQPRRRDGARAAVVSCTATSATPSSSARSSPTST